MQVEGSVPATSSVQENLVHLCQRVYQELSGASVVPLVSVEFRPYRSSLAVASRRAQALQVRLAEVFRQAPPRVVEAVLYVVLGKLLKRPVSPAYRKQYLAFLRTLEPAGMRTHSSTVRPHQVRWKGRWFDLRALFDELNRRFFDGRLPKPWLGWSRWPLRSHWGRYDPVRHAIILNSRLDRPDVPRLVVEYVLFHEMLHIALPTQTLGHRCDVHNSAFRAFERKFPAADRARQLLASLSP